MFREETVTIETALVMLCLVALPLVTTYAGSRATAMGTAVGIAFGVVLAAVAAFCLVVLRS
jgi:hypothetical protein